MNQHVILLSNRFVIFWRKNRIQNNLKHLIDHFRNDLFNEVIRCANIRIVVNFNQPNPEILVDHEVESKQLKLFLFITSIKKLLNGYESVTRALRKASRTSYFIRASICSIIESTLSLNFYVFII
jgi:hypothetical protein